MNNVGDARGAKTIRDEQLQTITGGAEVSQASNISGGANNTAGELQNVVGTLGSAVNDAADVLTDISKDMLKSI